MNPRALLAAAALAALLAAGPALSPAAAADPHLPVSQADTFVAETDVWMADLLAQFPEVPSFALTVVVDDQVVLARGYGVADLENEVPATGDSVYYIASATKSFTALAAAILEARGEIDLDDSLAEHAPGVEFDPAVRADEVKLRDLLTHTSGISNSPIAFRVAYTGEHDPDLLWALLAHSTRNEEAPLGSFDYTNSGYNILTMILDREAGRPWQDLLRDEIFGPAGMKHTTAYASLPRREGWELAAPYFGMHPEGMQRVPLEKQDNTMQSAGGMMTTANDLGRWLELQMNDGRVDGESVVAPEVIQATHALLVETGADGRPPFGQTAYGLGWSHGSWRDRPLLHHSGGFAGWRSLVSFLPEERVGVAVLTNEGSIGARLADAVAVWAYDWWLGVPAADRAAGEMTGGFAQMRDQRLPQMVEHYAERAAREWTLTKPLAAYAGTYTSDLYGTVRVVEVDGRLEVRQGNLHCFAEPYTKEESARVELVPGSGQVILFVLGDAGEVQTVVLDGDEYARVDPRGS